LVEDVIKIRDTRTAYGKNLVLEIVIFKIRFLSLYSTFVEYTNILLAPKVLFIKLPKAIP
jgi:hypothetical protein